MAITTLIQSLGHQFRDRRILLTALTHRSAGSPHNERLEFLGDALLGSLLAELLYHRFPAASEGELTRIRSSLVRRETLAQIARNLDLGSHILLGPGEAKSGGAHRDSMLADTTEAVLAAVYLDGGLEAVRALVHRLLEPHIILLDRLEGAETAKGSVELLKDSKTRLQESLQRQHRPLPSYRIRLATGADHQRQFSVECSCGEGITTCGEGPTRRQAEQEAARQALEIILNRHSEPCGHLKVAPGGHCAPSSTE